MTDDESNCSLNISPQNVLQSNHQGASNKSNSQVFLIVRSFIDKTGKQKGYPLEAGNIIKLGRMEYRVLETGHPNQKPRSVDQSKEFQRTNLNTSTDNINQMNQELLNMETDKIVQEGNKNEHSNEVRVCRICLEEADAISEEENHDEPKILISPCRCKGSLRYLHLSCFRHWFGSKVSQKQIGSTTTYLWKTCACEVCQEPIPRTFIVNGQQYSLFDLSINNQNNSNNVASNNEPYIILECINYPKKAPKIIHLCRISKENGQINIGRGHHCEVRISDISVSRLHAFIKYEDGQFLLSDNSSKFGTLVLLNEPFPICENKVAVQIGRTVMIFSLKKKSEVENNNHKEQQQQMRLENHQQNQKPSNKANEQIGCFVPNVVTNFLLEGFDGVSHANNQNNNNGLDDELLLLRDVERVSAPENIQMEEEEHNRNVPQFNPSPNIPAPILSRNVAVTQPIGLNLLSNQHQLITPNNNNFNLLGNAPPSPAHRPQQITSNLFQIPQQMQSPR